MKNYRNTAIEILCAILLWGSLCSVAGTPQETEDTISLQISTPKTTYRAGEKMVVMFSVVNREKNSIYLARDFICGQWIGYVDFRILNSRGQDVTNRGCDAFILPIPLDKVKQEVTESRGWMRLDPYEMYGEEGEFELPRQKGAYRLVAELMPPGFTKQQKELLASEQIHVLQVRYTAPEITIVVK